MQKNIPHDLLTFLILGSMQKQPTYGYAIIKMLEEKSGGRWSVSFGTVYGALNRMEKEGLLRQTDGGESKRKYFEMTAKGKKHLVQKRKEMKDMGEKSREMIIGFLNVYRNIQGEKMFRRLLDEIDDEFS